MLLVVLSMVMVGPPYLSDDLCPPELVCITCSQVLPQLVLLPVLLPKVWLIRGCPLDSLLPF